MAATKSTFLQQIQLLHILLVSGAAGMVGVFFFLGQQGMGPDDESLGEMLGWVSIALGAAAVVGGGFLKRTMLAGVKADSPLEKRVNTYRSATLVQLAMSEGAAAIGGVAYFMGQNMIGLIVAIAMIGWMVMLRPTADRVKQEAHLSNSELENA